MNPLSVRPMGIAMQQSVTFGNGPNKQAATTLYQAIPTDPAKAKTAHQLMQELGWSEQQLLDANNQLSRLLKKMIKTIQLIIYPDPNNPQQQVCVTQYYRLSSKTKP